MPRQKQDAPNTDKIDAALSLKMNSEGKSAGDIVFAHAQKSPPVKVSRQAVTRFIGRWSEGSKAKKTTLTVIIPSDEFRDLKDLAEDTRRTMTSIVSESIDQYMFVLNAHEKGSKFLIQSKSGEIVPVFT